MRHSAFIFCSHHFTRCRNSSLIEYFQKSSLLKRQECFLSRTSRRYTNRIALFSQTVYHSLNCRLSYDPFLILYKPALTTFFSRNSSIRFHQIAAEIPLLIFKMPLFPNWTVHFKHFRILDVLQRCCMLNKCSI